MNTRTEAETTVFSFYLPETEPCGLKTQKGPDEKGSGSDDNGGF